MAEIYAFPTLAVAAWDWAPIFARQYRMALRRKGNANLDDHSASSGVYTLLVKAGSAYTAVPEESGAGRRTVAVQLRSAFPPLGRRQDVFVLMGSRMQKDAPFS